MFLIQCVSCCLAQFNANYCLLVCCLRGGHVMGMFLFADNLVLYPLWETCCVFEINDILETF